MLKKIALVYAKPIYALMTVLTPVIFIVNQLAQGILTILRVDSSKKGSTITEHELRTIVNVSHQEGVLENEEHEMINNVFDFGDSLARDIMIPRIDVTFIDEDSSYEDLIELFRAQKHTRFPVYKETTDHIVGIVNVKDLLLLDKQEEFCLSSIMREPYFTFEYKKTSELLMEMKEESVSFAVVFG